MIEGSLPFSAKKANEVPKSYAEKQRPPFRAPAKCYAHGLKEYVLCFHKIPFLFLAINHNKMVPSHVIVLALLSLLLVLGHFLLFCVSVCNTIKENCECYDLNHSKCLFVAFDYEN